MSDSFADKLHRLKSTCEERVNRIADITQEILNEKEEIIKITAQKISDFDVISMKNQVSNLQLNIGK